MKIGAIIQVRMGSERFPGKVMYNVAGKPMIQYLLERLDHCTLLDTIVVATSTDDKDTQIADFCVEWGVNFYRGPLSNVAGRFKEVLDLYSFDGFVRINGDSPLLDQQLIDKGISIFLKGNFDVVTNIFPKSFPKGQSVEVVSANLFKKAFPLMKESYDLEHVTPYFYKKMEQIRIFNFSSLNDDAGIQLSVDTQKDMDMFTSIISKMKRPHWSYSLDEVIGIYKDVVLSGSMDEVSK